MTYGLSSRPPRSTPDVSPTISLSTLKTQRPSLTLKDGRIPLRFGTLRQSKLNSIRETRKTKRRKSSSMLVANLLPLTMATCWCSSQPKTTFGESARNCVPRICLAGKQKSCRCMRGFRRTNKIKSSPRAKNVESCWRPTLPSLRLPFREFAT